MFRSHIGMLLRIVAGMLRRMRLIHAQAGFAAQGLGSSCLLLVMRRAFFIMMFRAHNAHKVEGGNQQPDKQQGEDDGGGKRRARRAVMRGVVMCVCGVVGMSSHKRKQSG